MNDQGAPPKEIMGDMPRELKCLLTAFAFALTLCSPSPFSAGMDGTGPLGMPAMPDCPVQ